MTEPYPQPLPAAQLADWEVAPVVFLVGDIVRRRDATDVYGDVLDVASNHHDLPWRYAVYVRRVDPLRPPNTINEWWRAESTELAFAQDLSAAEVRARLDAA